MYNVVLNGARGVTVILLFTTTLPPNAIVGYDKQIIPLSKKVGVVDRAKMSNSRKRGFVPVSVYGPKEKVSDAGTIAGFVCLRCAGCSFLGIEAL
jgi:hypothetical protein